MLNSTVKPAPPAHGPTTTPNVIRAFSGATRQEREAAERLGAVYQELDGLKVHSLGNWAIPPPEVTPFPEYNREFKQALIATYNFNLDRELRARGARPDTLTAGMTEIIELQRRYRRDYYLIVPAIMQSAAVFAKKCLDAESVALSKLLLELTEQSSVAEWLNVAAKDILAAARNALPQAMRKEEALRSGRPAPAENVSQESEKGSSYLSPTEVQEILRRLARRKARYAGDHLIEVLLEHPEGKMILEEYAKSPEQGTLASTTRVREALGALNKFSESTINGGTFLRYPFFVLGGAVELNLHEIPGFKEYAVEITRILANDWRIEALGLGAIIVGCLSLALAGPAAPAIATVLLAGTDLALSGMLVFLEFMREREQDLGSRGSAYSREPIATPSLFTSTALAAASALVSALAFFGAAAQFRQVLNAPAKARAAAPPTPAPVKVPLNERGLPTNRVGGASWEEARATAPKETGVSEATKRRPDALLVGSETGISSPGVAKAHETKLPESGAAARTPSSKPPVERQLQSSKPSAPPEELDDLKLATFEGPDIAKPTKQEVEGARQALKEQLDTMVEQGIIDKPQFEDLVMSVSQEDTFARLNGALLSGTGKRSVPEGLRAERTAARQTAETRALDLRQRLAAHWDTALPGRGEKDTAEEAAKKLYQELMKEAAPTGTLNRKVRKRLYDNWRGRFINAVANDKDLVRDLKEWTGITFTPRGSKVTAFRVQAVDGKGNRFWVDLNFDHAFRHEDAVERAFRTGDSTWLRATVDSENLAPNLARENQVLKEGVNRGNESGWSVSPGPSPRANQPFR